MRQTRIKPIVKRAMKERERRRRVLQLPDFRLGGDGPPTIYYLNADWPRPSGGMRVSYQHVDQLNAAGLRAAVMHHRTGFSVDWFRHTTPVVWADSLALSNDDVLVVPEVYAASLHRLPHGPRVVSFNQNAYLTFNGMPDGERPDYFRFDKVVAVSSDSADYLEFAYPGLEVTVVPNAIDPSVFHPSQTPPGKRIAYMPRKRPEEATHVLRLLGDRLRGWDVVSIENESEAATAEIMRSSSIFLAFGHQEGFGLPPAEAMASGCHVIGFHGLGGREIFDPSVSVPVPEGDVLAFAQAVDQAIREYDKDPRVIWDIGLRAHRWVAEKYSPKRQLEELLRCYEGTAGR
jgi:glycosyltransferase involved in cell wall biosynthesis